MRKPFMGAAAVVLLSAVPTLAADFPYRIGGRISIATTVTGAPADNRSYQTAISPDGAAAAFWSDASNLVPGIRRASGTSTTRTCAPASSRWSRALPTARRATATG